MRILQLSSADIGGGAERIAYDLFHAYKKHNHDSRMRVGTKLGNDLEVKDFRSSWFRHWWNYSRTVEHRWLFRRIAGQLALLPSRPNNWVQLYVGREKVFSKRSWNVLKDWNPDILHAHNLHGGYFDIAALPYLSQRVPTFLTLHDAWLLSGHCAHSFDCERWKSGCGHCPYPETYPAIKRDATAFNWKRKQKLYEASHLYVATAARWLMEKIEQSIMLPGIAEKRVIPTGVDLSVFHPGDRFTARAALNLPPEAHILLFTANSIRSNPFKDFKTMRRAIEYIGARMENVILVALGETAPTDHIGGAEIRFIPYEANVHKVADYYRAADLYIHCARVDTFPNTVLEALASGLPTVATAVGGIPEQITHMMTGMLVAAGDADAIAYHVQQLLSAPEELRAMGQRAAQTARRYFDVETQARAYLSWYEEVLLEFQGRKEIPSNPSRM